jgi:hypothetical protein
MKKIKILGIALVASLFAVSCSEELLEIPKKGVISYEAFYDGSEESAESATLAAYHASMYCVNMGTGFNPGPWCIAPAWFVLSNAPSDDIYFGSGNPGDHVFGLEINEYRPSFSGTNDCINSNYGACYQAIYACNLVCDNFDPSTSSAIARNVAEARVLRAWLHLHLAIYWGTPPLIDHILDPADRPGNSDRKELMNWIINELKEAAEYLPSRKGKNDKDGAVRLTKEAALSFMGKAQVFAGDYAGAKTTLKRVIDSGNYDLVPGDQMMYMFHRAGDGSPEKVFEFNYVNNVNAGQGFRHFQRNASCWWRDLKKLPDITISVIGWGGGGNPSRSFVDAIMANEPDSYRRKAWLISYEELIGDFTYSVGNELDTRTREERLMDPDLGLSTDKYFGNCGWFLFKYAPYRSDLITNSSTDCDNNTVIMRYAEVLLLYAEACAQTGDNSGLTYLNMIQSRAGAPLSSSLTLDAVKKEKRFEMFMEGCRWADLVRWGDAASVLKDQGKEVPSFRDEFVPGVKPHKAVLDLSEAYYNEEYGFKPNKNELMPFPFNEILKNESLVQNPGWEK